VLALSVVLPRTPTPAAVFDCSGLRAGCLPPSVDAAAPPPGLQPHVPIGGDSFTPLPPISYAAATSVTARLTPFGVDMTCVSPESESNTPDSMSSRRILCSPEPPLAGLPAIKDRFQARRSQRGRNRRPLWGHRRARVPAKLFFYHA
jgi:hypothetical protein